MTQARYSITTKGSTTVVHRLGKAVGPIVRGTSFRRSADDSPAGAAVSARGASRKRKRRRAPD